MLERYRANEKIRNYRAGIVAASIYNVKRDLTIHPAVDPMDFFKSKELERELTNEELANGVEYVLRMAQASFTQ